MELLYLSRADVEAVELSMADIIDALEAMFREKGEGRVEMPPKPGIHPRPDAFLHAMPAYIPALGSAGLKWVSGFPENPAQGLPYISGLMILNDPDTGLPICVMDATWITAKRTGAATAVAAKYLAREESSSAAIVACGVQGRSHLEALASVFALGSVRAFDTNDVTAARFASEMSSDLGLEIEVVRSARDAVDGADLVVTSGPILRNPEPTIEASWLAPGSFSAPVDFDSYFRGDAIEAMDRFVTDDVGQLEYYRDAGYFQSTPAPDSDLGDVVCGNRAGREREDERILCMNLGLALDDVATAIRIYERARDRGIGRSLAL